MKITWEKLRLPLELKDVDMLPLTIAGKLINNKYLWAIRQSFFKIIPFLLAVSLFDILISVFLDPNGFILGSRWLNLGFFLTDGLTGDAYQQHYVMKHLLSCRHIVGMGYGVISMMLVITISLQMSKVWQTDKYATAFCAITAFMFMLPPLDVNVDSSLTDYFSERRFFSAFFASIAASWLFAFFCGKKWLRLPPFPRLGGDLSRYLAMSGPIALTLISFAAFTLAVEGAAFSPELVLRSSLSPEIFQLLPVALLYQLVVWFLWWLGIPGYGFTSGVERFAYVSAQNSNQLGDAAHIFTSGFFETGIMHGLGLIIAVLVFSRHETWRAVAKWCLPLAIFNIHEPVAFGMPIVLNPLFLVPYILAPLANTVIGYIAIYWGIVPVFQSAMPWTMPVIISGIAGTSSFMGGVLQMVWLIMDIFIYAPFVLLANVVELDEDAADPEKRGEKS